MIKIKALIDLRIQGLTVKSGDIFNGSLIDETDLKILENENLIKVLNEDIQKNKKENNLKTGVKK